MIVIGPETGTVKKSVSGQELRVPQPFEPGMQLDEDQALFLNQVFAKEYVKALRPVVKRAQEELGGVDSLEARKELSAAVGNFAKTFRFVVETEKQRQRRIESDPVWKASFQQVKQWLSNKVRFEKGEDPKDWDLDAEARKWLGAHPEYVEQQRKMLAQIGYGESPEEEGGKPEGDGAAGAPAGPQPEAQPEPQPEAVNVVQLPQGNGQDMGEGQPAHHPWWGTVFPGGYPDVRDFEDESGLY